MLELGKTAPLIKGGTPVRRYACGEYQAVLVRDPESFGPIKYPHLLVVFRATETSPIMFITAEQSTISSALMKIAAKQFGEDFGENAGHSVFLCIFSESGHANLGSSSDYAILEKFEVESLAIMRQQLGIHASVSMIHDFTKEKKGFWSRLFGS